MKRKKLIILIVIIIIIIILIPSVFFFIVCKDAEKSDLRLKIYSNKNEYDINTSSIKIDIELKNIGNCPIYIEKIFSFSLNLNLDITTPNGILLEHIHEVLTYVPKKDILFPNDIKKETINLKSEILEYPYNQTRYQWNEKGIYNIVIEYNEGKVENLKSNTLELKLI